MTILLLIFASGIPFWFQSHQYADAYNLPKLAWLSVVGVLIWFHFHNRSIAGEKQHWPLIFPIGLYLAASLISGVNAVSYYAVLNRTLFDCLGISIFWYAASLPVATTRKAMTYAPLFVVPALILSFSGIVGNWRGTFGNPEHGASLIATSALMGSAAAATYPAYTILAGICFLALYLSTDRSAIIGLVLGSMAWLFARARYYAWRVTAVGALVFALLFVPLERYFHLAPDRAEGWKPILSKALEQPVFGWGRGNYELHSQVFVQRIVDEGLTPWFKEAHNDYLELFFEAGVFGLMAFVYLLYRVLWPIPEGIWAAALFIAMITTLVRALFLFPFQLPAESAWFWVSAGAYWRLRNA